MGSISGEACERRGETVSKMWEFTKLVQLNIENPVVEIPRWQLEVGSRMRASYSEILERRWRHTLQT
jgi:hypothetical protein